jgi:hypothetical protein
LEKYSISEAGIKVKVLSFLTEHHAMKAYWRSGGTTLHIL